MQTCRIDYAHPWWRGILVTSCVTFISCLSTCRSDGLAREAGDTRDAQNDSTIKTFEGFDWKSTCSSLLGGNGSIVVTDSRGVRREYKATWACGFRGTYHGEFYLELGLGGALDPSSLWRVTLHVPLNSLGTLPAPSYEFDPTLSGATDDVILRSYYYSGYNEMTLENRLTYPGSTQDAGAGGVMQLGEELLCSNPFLKLGASLSVRSSMMVLTRTERSEV